MRIKTQDEQTKKKERFLEKLPNIIRFNAVGIMDFTDHTNLMLTTQYLLSTTVFTTFLKVPEIKLSFH